MSSMLPLKEKLKDLFAIDIRALALLRISLSFIVLLDLINQCPYIKDFYTDEGILPRVDAIKKMGSYVFSLHAMSGSLEFEVVLFILAGIFAIGLLVGYHTRLCSLMTWFFLCSLHHRNPFLVNAGDRYLHILLFWCLFLPLGACYSMDSRRKSQRYPLRFFSMGTVGLFFQIIFFYVFAGFLKTSPVWTTDGTAVFYCLNVQMFGKPLDYCLLQHPHLLRYMTFAVLWLERWGAWFFLFPWKTTYVRLMTIAGFALFHIGLLLTMELKFFQWISLAALIVFLPTSLLDTIFRRWPVKIQEHKVRRPLYGDFLAVFFIFYILLWNLMGLENSNYRISQQMQWIGRALNINQHWGMYAPYPMVQDGWFITPGKLRDGTMVDVRTGGSVNLAPPDSIVQYNKDHRWTLFYLFYSDDENVRYRLGYGDYLCREWNKNHSGDKQLLSLEIVLMATRIHATYKETKAEPKVLQSYYCFRKNKKNTNPIFNESELK
jgi:hypothetical protein